MNKLFSKIAALSVGLAMAVGVGVALGHQGVREARAEASYSFAGEKVTFADQGLENSVQYTGLFSSEVFSVQFAGGGNDGKYYTTGAGMRTYGGGSFTITGISGTLTSATFVWDGTYKPSSNVADSGEFNSDYTVWTGEADSVVFTRPSGSGHWRLKSIEVTVEEAGTKYSVIDRIDNGSLNKTEATEGKTLSVTIVPDDGYVFPETLSYVYMAGSPVEYSYVNGVVTIQNVQGNITIEGACVKVNPILALYSKADKASSGEFYGYYVGFATGSGPILMDGEYGIMLFNASQDVSDWVEGETIIHVTSGTISIYNGLYEVKSYAFEKVTTADVSAPIVHVTTGNESATEANRLTSATGKVATAPSKGSFEQEPGASDVQFTYTVGTKTFTVFYKKAAQTSEVLAVLADSLANGTEIVLKGFTSWYNGFQLTMTGLIEAVDTYTAEQFAQDLLDQTDAVCAGWKEGDDNHDALVAIWSNLAANDKYPSLPSDQKTILAEAERDEEGTVIEQAMARYDFLTGKYELSNFINGRTPIQSNYNFAPSFGNNNSYIIIIVISAVSVMSFGLALFLRKKRSK